MARRTAVLALALVWHRDGDGVLRLGPARIVERQPRYAGLVAEHLRRTPSSRAIRHVTVLHDDGCGHWRGHGCSCTPAIVERGR